jgi:CheY-like chemotaxis protein
LGNKQKNLGAFVLKGKNMPSNILVVENDKAFRKTLCDYLEIEGYKIIETQVIPEAEKELHSHHFDAAVVDVRMQNDENVFDWSGLILARFIAGYAIPVIILTAFDKPEDVARAYKVAPGIEPPYAFISKYDQHFLEKVSKKLGEVAISRGGVSRWLHQNWDKLVGLFAGIFKKAY